MTLFIYTNTVQPKLLVNQTINLADNTYWAPGKPDNVAHGGFEALLN